ncbi:MAG: glycosyltransferase [Vicinamibacterales bacterium]
MRILIVHNSYQQRGGEDAVVEAESELLAGHGHDVQQFTRHNDELTGLGHVDQVAQALWSRPSSRALTDLLGTFRPDVMHVHNTWPLISPSIYWVAAHARVPVVQTLHNFRLLCPEAKFLRDGRVCEDCLGHLPWRGAVRGCYRGSKAQSAVLAGMLTLHRAIGTYSHKIARYIALNEFCRRKFIAGGLPAERIVVKPNFVDFGAPTVQPRNGFLFVGRLSAEKGVVLLARAAASAGVTVRVAGTGPDAALLQGAAAVKELGILNGSEVYAEMAGAMALVMPSIWHEHFPRTLVEAFASGLPVIASRIGSLAELVDDGVTGLLFEPGNAPDLADKMRWAQAHPQQMAQMGFQARARYDAAFTADRNHDQLVAIYQAAISEVAGVV